MIRRRTKSNGYIPLRRVAAMIGEPWCAATRMRLARRFKSRELLLGRKLMWRDRIRGHWTTTESAVRGAFPEWFDRRDEVAVLLAEQLEDYEAERKRLSDRLDALVWTLSDLMLDQPGKLQAILRPF